MSKSNTKSNLKNCVHCEDKCVNPIYSDSLVFCCEGCKTVYQILKENNLEEFYDLSDNPGFKIKSTNKDKYSFLENKEIANSILDFHEKNFATLTFLIPTIHCSSCIWLLENLGKIHNGIINVKVNFLKKEAKIEFNPQLLSTHSLACLLHDIGYGPEINWESQNSKKPKPSNTAIVKLGVAAFAFGNIMLLSFPEYLGLSSEIEYEYKFLFGLISFILSIPVVFYCASDYFISAFKAIRASFINIDLPIAIGIITLFIRSTFEFIQNGNPGYLDSLSGLVFFLLIGKWFQSKTYENLSFDRDYKSYFPLAVYKLINGEKISIPVKDLYPGDEIFIRNEEIIPADSILLDGATTIDYSFVTGESRSVDKIQGEIIYAGGRQQGQEIRLRIIKKTSQSYLTGLWNNSAHKGELVINSKRIIDKVGKYFTIIILFVAFLSGVYWQFIEPNKVWDVVSAILIVACPCALALTVPFTYGSIIRLFGKNEFYVRSADTLEILPSIKTIIFDKTGTLTIPDQGKITLEGGELNKKEKSYLHTLASASAHPLSRKITEYLATNGQYHTIDNFYEIPGKGLEGFIDNKHIKIGNKEFTNNSNVVENFKTRVYFSIEDRHKGFFEIETEYIPELKGIIQNLKKRFRIAVLSGDNDSEKNKLSSIFEQNVDMKFNSSPADKVAYVEHQKKYGGVMMVGDGLNDGAALLKSDFGIAVTNESSTFSPSSYGLISTKEIKHLNKFLKIGIMARKIIVLSFIISFLYNIIGLSFAISGYLSPIIAAILMPLSSITVVVFTTAAVNLYSKKVNL